MKRICLISFMYLSVGYSVNAQLTDGSMAPDFTFIDINGTTQNLYSYLNQGKSVVLDVSATWCAPCWNYSNLKVLDSLFALHDVPGDQQWKIMFMEADGNTTSADLQGTGTNTQGNWLQGKNYTFIDPSSGPALTAFSDGYSINFFPTFYLICPDKKVYFLPNSPSVANWESANSNCASTGVNNLNEGSTFNMFPNPSKDFINVQFSLKKPVTVTLQIFSITGKMVSQQTLHSLKPGNHSLKYSVRQLNTGIYFLTLTLDDDRREIKKLIVE